jgi:uncharacterized membrane protein YphA (DoxX/SURF4 family)
MLDVDTAAYQAFWLLRIGFTVAPILFGIDKFFNWTVYWPQYLAPWINEIVPGNGQDFMYVGGGVEIFAGLLVAFAPRIGAFVVAGWLAGIVVNLLTNNAPQYYDIALRPAARRPHARAACARGSSRPQALARLTRRKVCRGEHSVLVRTCSSRRRPASMGL